MRIYQVIQGSGEWEDYHEWVVYTTTDRAKAEYIKRVLYNREQLLIDRDKWECWVEPSGFRADIHEVDKADDSSFAFLDTMVNQRGKLKSPIFVDNGDITND